MNDKSELIDEVLDTLINRIEWSVKVPGAVEIDREYQHRWKAQTKATLQKAFREVEIEGRIKALTDVDNLNLLNDSDVWHKFYLAEIAKLTKIKEQL